MASILVNATHGKEHLHQQAAIRQALAIVPANARNRILRIRITRLPHADHALQWLYGQDPRLFCRTLPPQNTSQQIVGIAVKSLAGQAVVARRSASV